MKKFCRLLSLALIMSMFVLVFVGCNNNPKADDNLEFNVFMPDGAPALSFAKFMDGSSFIENVKLNYNIVTGDAIVGKVANNEADIAIMPTNAAANVVSKGSKYKLVSVNLMGLLYVIGNGESATLNDLVGKVVYSIGKGNTPEFVFKYILTHNSIEYVESDTAVEGKIAINFVQDASNIIPLIKTGKIEYGLLGEPAVTTAQGNGINNLIDLQAMWKTATNSDISYPQACMVVKTSIIESNPQFVNSLVTELMGAKSWLVENSSRVAEVMTANGSLLKTQYTVDTINRCNIDVIKAVNAKEAVRKYLEVIYNFSPAFIGGSMPSDEFYYIV